MKSLKEMLDGVLTATDDYRASIVISNEAQREGRYTLTYSIEVDNHHRILNNLKVELIKAITEL